MKRNAVRGCRDLKFKSHDAKRDPWPSIDERVERPEFPLTVAFRFAETFSRVEFPLRQREHRSNHKRKGNADTLTRNALESGQKRNEFEKHGQQQQTEETLQEGLPFRHGPLHVHIR